jgi:hypothetical protein
LVANQNLVDFSFVIFLMNVIKTENDTLRSPT